MVKSNLNSVSFDLEIVHGKKRLFTIDIVSVLYYIKNIFIDSKVVSAEICDHHGKKYRYREGKFQDNNSSIKLDKPRDLSSVYGWKGSIDLKTNQLRDLVQKLSPLEGKHDASYTYFWKFDENSFNFRQVIGFQSAKSKLLPPNLANFAFGTIVNNDCFVIHFATPAPKVSDFNIKLFPHKNQLILMFTVIDNTGVEKKVKICYDYNSIKSIINHHVAPIGFSLYADLSYAPKMFVADGSSYLKNGEKNIKWQRKSSCGPVSENLLGKCNVLRLTWLSIDASYLPDLYSWCRHLKIDLTFGQIIQRRTYFVNEVTDLKFPHRIEYALTCIKSLSFSYEDDLQINHKGEKIMNEFVQQQICAGKLDQVERALHRLYYDYVNGKVCSVYEHFKNLLSEVELEWVTIKDHGKDTEHIKFIKTGVFTPTRKVFLPPQPQRVSRLLDSAEPDCVLRVIYRDESNGSLSSTFRNFESNQMEGRGDDEENVDCLTSMLKGIAKNGLCVAGRTYRYYGASPSQLKDGGMILYTKDSQNRTAASIRDSLGIVKERSVPKYMARIGLSLSQAIAFVDLPDQIEIYLTPDIYGGSHPHSNKAYNFTDGCGSLSVNLAHYIYNDLIRQKQLERKGDDSYVPSAFQIRFLGSKGMLVVDPGLTGMTIVLRESMQKMFAKKDKLGIVKVSEPRRAYLNRPFIMILNQIGLSNEFFAKLITSTLRDLNSSFHDEQVAVMTLKLYSHLHRVVNIDAFADCGFNFTSDSFFNFILRLAMNQALDGLRNKQRIPLPWFEARTMLGVCDITAKSPKTPAGEFVKQGICQPSEFPVYKEGLGTGVLKAGQVFCWPSDFSEPLRGELIVTKFPTNDLGGVRRLVAVDCKELHMIRDCIVFPVDGERPHQDEMAGSDLDGDEYCVIWTDEILQIKEHKPTNYPVNPKVEMQDEISDELMIEHHINCVKYDQIGQIGNTILVHADCKGFDSPVCQRLNPKYNGALDAPKNGFNSELLLEYGDLALEAPDYMNKWSVSPTYLSTSACGVIYRLVNLHEHSSELLHVPARFELSSDTDERLLHPRMLEYITFAGKGLLAYQAIIKQLLTIYSLKSEAELFTGILSGSSSSIHNELSRCKDKEDVMIATINSLLINKMNEIFDLELVNASEDDKMAAASAIYYVSKQRETRIGLPFIGKCGYYLRQYMKCNVTAKKQEKTQTTKTIAVRNKLTMKDLSMVLIIRKVKNKLKDIIETFSSSHGKTMEISWQIDKFMSRDDSCVVLSLPEDDLIAKLVQETKQKWTNLAGLKNNELNFDQFIDTTIPTLFWSLMVDETSLYKIENRKSDFLTQSFLVRCSKSKILNSLWNLLKKTSAVDTQIEILFDSKEKNSIPVVIYGSPTSILVASIIIGIHNRLCSIYFKRYVI